MRIVHICCANFYRDNCGYQENILPKYHVKAGLETYVIASLVNKDMENNRDFYDEPRTYEVDGYKVIRIPYRYGKVGKVLRTYKGLHDKLKSINPDIIFVHGVQFFDIREVEKYVKSHTNVKLYIDNHGDYFNGAKSWISKNIMHKVIWKSGAKKIEPYCKKFYGVTPIRCDFLHDMYGINRDKIDLLVMGADDEMCELENRDATRAQIRNHLNISKDDFVLVTGGRLVDRKNIPELLQAVTNLNQDYKNVKLIVFGSLSSEIKEKMQPFLKNENIKYIGWIPSDNVYKYFIAADLGIFPGTHSVLWEQAVGVGLPCVFKYWNGMQHVDLGGNCSFLEDISVDGISDIIKDIYLNSEKLMRMQKVSVEKGIDYFSYESIAARAINITK